MGNISKIRGSTTGQEISPQTTVRDIRPNSTKMWNFLDTSANSSIIILSLAITVLIYPQFWELFVLIAIFLATRSMFTKISVPLKLPVQSGMVDLNELKPGAATPQLANGIFFLGNESSTGKELWLTNSDCRQHILVLGTTGAGKTETLLGFAANALTWGSGFLFCDGKGDVTLFAKVYALARSFGREDDILVLNFMTGNRDVNQNADKIRSNTLNPFTTGSSDTLAQMMISLMDEVGGDGAMWKGRATSMFTGIIRALVWLRDFGNLELNVSVVRQHLNFNQILDLANPQNHPQMPSAIKDSIKSYLSSLPGYREGNGYKQSQTTLDQHGYLEMQFTKILGSLADVYGYIFNTTQGEVDMMDVVLNRRILVIMLPALEKSRDEISNIGKIIVATLKGMMGATLGSEIEGPWYDIVENRPSNSSSPFICILDEVGNYMVGGMDLMAAQARSLGFTMVYAGQDINAMKSINEKVFGSVRGNTNTKIIMRTEDPETASMAKDDAGKATRAQMMQLKKRQGFLSKFYGDQEFVKLEEVNRVNTLDLKSQTEGEMHIIYKDKVVRANAFHAAPESIINVEQLYLRTNSFIKIDKSALKNAGKLQNVNYFVNKLLDPDSTATNDDSTAASEQECQPLTIMSDTLDYLADTTRIRPVEHSCIALAAAMKIFGKPRSNSDSSTTSDPTLSTIDDSIEKEANSEVVPTFQPSN